MISRCPAPDCHIEQRDGSVIWVIQVDCGIGAQSGIEPILKRRRVSVDYIPEHGPHFLIASIILYDRREVIQAVC